MDLSAHRLERRVTETDCQSLMLFQFAFAFASITGKREMLLKPGGANAPQALPRNTDAEPVLAMVQRNRAEGLRLQVPVLCYSLRGSYIVLLIR